MELNVERTEEHRLRNLKYYVSEEAAIRAMDSRNWPQNREVTLFGDEVWRLKPEEIERDPGSKELCDLCQTINFRYLAQNLLEEDNKDEIILGYLDDISAKVHCAFCRLVFKAVCAYTGNSAPFQYKGKRVKCYMFNDRLRPRHGFRYLCIVCIPVMPGTIPTTKYSLANFESLGAAIRPLTTDYPWSISYKGSNDRPAADIMIRYMRDSSCYNDTFGRELRTVVNFDVLNEMLRNGEEMVQQDESFYEKHPFSRSPPLFDDLPLPPKNFKLIDVERLCLVESEDVEEFQYLALSYVWGLNLESRFLKARQDAKLPLDVEGGISPDNIWLPRVIRDAITITKGLSTRYLWFDCLCIPQDEPAILADQLSYMAGIYNQARCTIVAAAGLDADTGLLGAPETPRTVSQHIEVVRGFSLSNLCLEINPSLDSAVWNTRGWTYQERLFSSILMIFGPDQVHVNCRHKSWSEDTHSGYESAWISADTHQIPECSSNWMKYTRHVANYSIRKLSYQSDALNAFSGILTASEPWFRSTFIYGLPESSLDQALLWQAQSPLRRRQNPKSGDFYFPSYSWAAWEGPLSFPPAHEISSRVMWRDFAENSELRFFCEEDINPPRTWDGWSTWKQESGMWTDDDDEYEEYYSRPLAPMEDRSPIQRYEPSTGCIQFWTHSTLLKVQAGTTSNYFFEPLSFADSRTSSAREGCIKDIVAADQAVIGILYLDYIPPTPILNANLKFILLSRTWRGGFTMVGRPQRSIPQERTEAYAAAMGLQSIEHSAVEIRASGKSWDEHYFQLDKMECHRNDDKKEEYNVMCVITDDLGVSSRIGIGIIDMKAFHEANPLREIITLS